MARESESASIAGDIACDVSFGGVESWIRERLSRRSSIEIESGVGVVDVSMTERAVNAILEGSGASPTRVAAKRLVERSSIDGATCPNESSSGYGAEVVRLLRTDLL